MLTPMPILYVGSSNPGKLRDFSLAAELFNVAIAPLPGLASIAPPPEDALTFEGNARTKAIYYSNHAPGELVLADDSGLEVDALDGHPGVRSARYASDSGAPAPPQLSTDAWNNEHLLAQLSGVMDENRSARYRSVLAVAHDGRALTTAAGSLEGRILASFQGSGGFGYDPLFYLPELQLTMAEVDPALRQSLSHRGRALQSLLQQDAMRALLRPGDSAPGR